MKAVFVVMALLLLSGCSQNIRSGGSGEGASGGAARSAVNWPFIVGAVVLTGVAVANMSDSGTTSEE